MQFKYIVATIASLAVSSVLAGPMPKALVPDAIDENALTARGTAELQAHANELVRQAKAGQLGEQSSQSTQQRLNAAHAQFPSVKSWLPYCAPDYDDWWCYPGTLSYDFDFAFNFGYCSYW